MTPSLRRAGALAFAVVALGVVAWNLVPPRGSAAPSTPYAYSSPPAAPIATPGVVAPAAAAPAPAANETRDYAIALGELQGFPPDTPPGARLELWVTWDRPVTDGPKLQRVLPDASLVRVVPPVTPDGLAAVVVRVPVDRMPKLLYADAYGLLSASVVP